MNNNRPIGSNRTKDDLVCKDPGNYYYGHQNKSQYG